MPCYVVQLQSLEFKAKNRDMVMAMLEANGYSYQVMSNGRVRVSQRFGQAITIDFEKQTITGAKYDTDSINKIRRQYSEHILTVAAKKKKWVLKKKASGKFVAKKW